MSQIHSISNTSIQQYNQIIEGAEVWREHVTGKMVPMENYDSITLDICSEFSVV